MKLEEEQKFVVQGGEVIVKVIYKTNKIRLRARSEI